MKPTVWCALAVVASMATACGQSSAPADSAAGAAAPGPTEVPAADLQPCPVIGNRRVTAQDCELAAQTEQDVQGGVAAFNWPKEMRREKTVLLRLAVGRAPPAPATAPEGPAPPPEPTPSAAPDTTAGATPGPEAPGPPPPPPPKPEDSVKDLEGETVPYAPLVGRYMSARLSGDGMTIVAKSPEHQEVLPDSVTTWDWEVTPKAGGRHTMTITTQVEFKDSSNNYIPLRFRPETRQIEVKVPWWLWVKDTLSAMPGWIKLVTGVLTALTALFGAWAALKLALRGKKPAPAPKPPA